MLSWTWALRRLASDSIPKLILMLVRSLQRVPTPIVCASHGDDARGALLNMTRSRIYPRYPVKGCFVDATIQPLQGLSSSGGLLRVCLSPPHREC